MIWGPKTKALLVASPANPTGTMLSHASASSLAQAVRELGGVMVVDEIYQRVVFEGAPKSLVSLGEDIISVNSFSKTFSMTGWRLGWLVVPPSVLEQMGKLVEFNTSCAPVFVQRGAVEALRHEAAITPALVAHLRQCRDTLIDALLQVPGLTLARPLGGMYAFFRVDGHSDSLTLAKRLVTEAGLGLAPGSAFAPEAEGWLRWCFASQHTERLLQGVDRLQAWMRR